jgi:tetratricopeptide (TPR) repeat protein
MPWRWIIAGCVTVAVVAILLPRPKPDLPGLSTAAATASSPQAESYSGTASRGSSPLRIAHCAAKPAAAEVVAAKVSQFALNRLEIVRAIARARDFELPAEIERFFELVKSGDWEALRHAFEALNDQRMGTAAGWNEDLSHLWPAILETYGVAEVAHDWPAQWLLDYGQTLLDSLRPDMVYVGGTDPGRFIPTLLNETSDDGRHIVITQNALADGSYLEYLSFLYGDRLATLTSEDSQNCFEQYVEDARRRLLHDQQFPDEPQQVRPGEHLQFKDGGLQVSGQVAVIAINERLLQTLLQKNPDLSFALEEGFPFKSTYADATPLGPLMELRVRDSQNTLTAERAAQSIEDWRATTRSLLSDPSTPEASDPRKAYAKLILAQANLFLDRNFTGEAEQAYRLANELCPSGPEAVFNYVSLLMKQGRVAEATRVAQTADRLAPGQAQFRQLLEQLQSLPASPTKRMN